MDCLERIRTLLEERGWSVYRLAQEAGVPQSTLANLFLRNNMPTVPTLERICQALGITMAEFFSQQPTLPPEEELTAQLLKEWAALSPAQKRLVLELVRLGNPAPLFTYNALFIPGFFMAGLLFQVMSALFRQASELKEDQDLTI